MPPSGQCHSANAIRLKELFTSHDAKVAVGFLVDDTDVVTHRSSPQSKAGLPLDVTQGPNRDVTLRVRDGNAPRALRMRRACYIRDSWRGWIRLRGK